MNSEEKIYYICDGKVKRCKGNSGCYKNDGECKHTSDINHALNFNPTSIGYEEARTIEDTLQSIDATLKRIEEILLNQPVEGGVTNIYNHVSDS